MNGNDPRWAQIVASVGRWLRPVVPLLFVTGFAMYGQIAYGLAEYSPATAPLFWRLLVAVGAAVAVESIALYVGWHAHDALLMGATATAARLRRGSYFLAIVVAAVNYSHFAAGWAPTPAAVVFALFSASGPWLWGLHTRRAQRIQLLRDGQVDTAGAVFSAERRRAFPFRTWAARRWSIDHGVTDPRQAWEGYNADRANRQPDAAPDKPAHSKPARPAPAVPARIVADIIRPAEPEPAITEPVAVIPPAEPEAEEQAEAPQPNHSMSYADAVAWAIREDAGAKRIQSHCGLSEYHAKRAARDAKRARELRIAR